MEEQFDFIIIGAGLSGLIHACIYAKEGAKVCIIEKQKIPGGYLQTFARKKYRFDTGFHYIGSTNPGKPLRSLLGYLGIFDSLPIHYYDEKCFFQIANSSTKFLVPSSLQMFIHNLQAQFPQEKLALEEFYSLIKSITSSFRWYNLKKDHKSVLSSFPTYSLAQWLENNLQDQWLKTILATFSFNIGLRSTEIPIVPYAICLDSIFDRPIWLHDGGDGLVKPLLEKLEELHVPIYLDTSAVKLNCQNKLVQSVTTISKSVTQELKTKCIISTVHPKLIMPMLDDNDLRPLFKKNILEMKDSRGSFGINIILKEELTSIEPINHICLVENKLYDGIYFNSPSLLNAKIKTEIPYRPRLNICTFIDSEPFMKFSGTKFGKRPTEYTTLKEQYTKSILNDLFPFIPDLKQKIDTIYTSSPLTNEHYTSSVNGSSFGISHDIHHQTIHRPSPRTRIKNLFFSGQSINMPGICGVIVNAFSTAGLILGEDYLFDKVVAAE